MHLWYSIQNAVIVNQIIGAILVLVFSLLDMKLYTIMVLGEMGIAFLIWWKVMVK